MDKLAITLVVLVLLMVGDGAILAQGPLVPAKAPDEVVFIPFPVTITPDGSLADWADIPAVVVGEAHEGFSFQLAADNSTLYLAMTARQSAPARVNAAFELYLNLTADLNTDTYRDGIIQLIFSTTDIGNSDPAALSITGINSQTITPTGFMFGTDQGWGLELAIPLTEIFIRSDCPTCGFPPPQDNTPFHGREIGLQAILRQPAPDQESGTLEYRWAETRLSAAGTPLPSTFGRGLYFETGRTEIPQPSPTLPRPSFDPAGIDWQALVTSGWQSYSARFIMCGMACGINMGLVFDIDAGHLASSQHAGYGMLMAVIADDQAMFDVIHGAAEHWLLDVETGLHHQQVDAAGRVTLPHSLSSAEADIAAALILAQAKVDSGLWQPPPEAPYGAAASALIDALYEHAVQDGLRLLPGTAPSAQEEPIMHLGQFAPAWYRLFDAFQGTTRWDSVIQLGYLALYNTPESEQGLLPTWTTAYGEPVSAPPGYQAGESPTDSVMSWRVALDCLWFEAPPACNWTQRAAETLTSQPAFASNPAQIGAGILMARAAGDTLLEAHLAEALYALQVVAEGSLHFGDTPTALETQTMAWLGTALLSGDLNNPYLQ